jgi:hypothetical protein
MKVGSCQLRGFSPGSGSISRGFVPRETTQHAFCRDWLKGIGYFAQQVFSLLARLLAGGRPSVQLGQCSRECTPPEVFTEIAKSG